MNAIHPKVWEIILQELGTQISLPENWTWFFFNWKDSFPGTIRSEPALARIWSALPKYVFCKVWTARNKRIFEEIPSSPAKSAVSAKSLLCETFIARGISGLRQKQLMDGEKSWIRAFFMESSLQSKITIKKEVGVCWRIDKEPHEFQN